MSRKAIFGVLSSCRVRFRGYMTARAILSVLGCVLCHGRVVDLRAGVRIGRLICL
jgi:hypothetical protein